MSLELLTKKMAASSPAAIFLNTFYPAQDATADILIATAC